MTNREIDIDYDNLEHRYYPSIVEEDVRLIFDFFFVFSRFEFVLKKIGYRKTYEKKRVSPNWDAFAEDFGKKFDHNKTEDLKQAVSYYINCPPEIQVLSDNKLDWAENLRQENETDFAWIIRSIRVTRNNLFHGGKFPWDPMRDPKLLYYGLVILYECLDLDESLYKEFIYSP